MAYFQHNRKKGMVQSMVQTKILKNKSIMNNTYGLDMHNKHKLRKLSPLVRNPCLHGVFLSSFFEGKEVQLGFGYMFEKHALLTGKGSQYA